MKICIAGSRVIFNSRLVFDLLDQTKLGICGVISGMQVGVDTLGRKWAESKGIQVLPFPVTKDEWKIFGKSAGMRRNKRMAEIADALILIWNGESSGSRNMKELMQGKLIEETIVNVPKPFITQTENNLREFISRCCQKPFEVTVFGDEGKVDEETAWCSKCDKGYYLERDRNSFLWIGK
jgi:hypothetical protein